MTPWADLTERGKLRRLRRVALAALEHYPIHVERLRLVGGFTNAVFRVDAGEGVFAVRVDVHQDHSELDAAVELAWLTALESETELDVVRIIPAADGRLSVDVAAPGVPGERRCVLFSWVPGVPLADRLSEAGYAALGGISAALLHHGATYQPPHRPMAWDRVFYYPESVDPVVIDRPENRTVFTGNRRQVFDAAMERVTIAFRSLDATKFQILHGDLHPWNVHSYRSRLIVFDFEDVMWGHPVQDVAITLFYQRDEPAYPDLRAAFESGFGAVAPWPERYAGEIEHFMAARTLNFINYVLNLHDDPREIREFHDRMFTRLEQFLTDWA